MGGRGGGSSVRSPIVVAQQTIAEANALADMDIRDAYQQVIDITNPTKHQQGGPWVTIQRMRTALSSLGWSRQRQDEQLRRFIRDRKGVAIPESNQKTMTQAFRESALRIGNEDKHIFSIKDWP